MIKKIALGILASAVLGAFLLFHSSGMRQPVIVGSIPIPFGNNGSTLQGSLTLFGQRNGINVYEVEFNHGEVSEHLVPDRIYLVHVPNDATVSDVPMDLAWTLSGTGGHLVDYYGYRYTDAAATTERRDGQAFLFKDRFPGQFFASQTARNGDITHGRSIANFESANKVTFLPTDGTTGSVRLDPAGSLYVFVVNVPGGAEFAIRNLSKCGNKIVDTAEQCDDGNTIDNDHCHNICTLGIPVPFDGGPTGSGASLTVAQFAGTTGSAATGAVAIPLVRFTAIASSLTMIKHLAFAAETGSLTNLEHYTLWQDTDGNGVTDLPVTFPIAAVGNRIVFDSPISWNGILVLSHSGTIFELKADVPLHLQGTKLIRVGFAQSEPDFIGGQRNAGTFPLFGIKKNGVCTTAICQIFVTTAQSALWTIGADPALCGNNVMNQGEQCDSGSANGTSCALDGQSSCTYCSASCTNVTVHAAAGSSSSSSSANSASSSTPIAAVCGNGTLEQGEACDDQNTNPSDGCTATCTVGQNFNCTQTSPSVCVTYNQFVKNLADTNHNGTVSDNEALLLTIDLADAQDKPFDTVKKFDINNDGVIDTIDLTLIFAELDILAPSGPLCGNNTRDAGEECDDGNTVNTDDCDNTCSLTTPTPGFNSGVTSLCGNGVPNAGEECDDGNTVNTDDCDNTCHLSTPTPAV